MTEITRIAVKSQLRGFSLTPTHGRCATKFVVELGADKRWRRVYDRFGGERADGSRIWVACVKDGAEYRDLTPDETARVGYDFHSSRRISAEEAAHALR